MEGYGMKTICVIWRVRCFDGSRGEYPDVLWETRDLAEGYAHELMPGLLEEDIHVSEEKVFGDLTDYQSKPSFP